MTERYCHSVLKDKPDVLTVLEVAEILRIGKNKAYTLLSSGRLYSIKIGGKIIVPKIHLVSFLLDKNNSQISSQIIPNNAGFAKGNVI